MYLLVFRVSLTVNTIGYIEWPSKLDILNIT